MTDPRILDLQLGDPVDEGNRTVTVRARWRSAVGAGEEGGVADRPVLVKTLKPGIRLSPEIVRAFQREADLLARLAHPGLPTLVELVVEPDGVALVVPDDGGTRLEVLLGQLGRLEPATAMAIGLEVARALAAVHHRGEVHGRVVGSNVELTPSGSVRLFGLAAGGGESGDGTGASAEEDGDEVLPLPEDMAPEQIIGEQPDVRTDVFQVGLLLYRMVAGDKPFRGGDGLGVAQRIRHGPAPRLQRRVASTPPSLERIVARCLSRRARDRFPDMPSLATALIAALRAHTSTPTELLVNEALVRAGLAEELLRPGELGRAPTGPQRQRLLQRALLVGAAGAAVLLSAWLIARAVNPGRPEIDPAVRGIEQQPARLRVLAHPWAEVFVDDERIDVTPIGRPVEVKPGRHRVRFKHPNAPDQLRTVEVIAGQTLWLDVTMPVVRPAGDAGADAGAATDASP